MNIHKKYVLNLVKRNFICAEIGVWKGEFSQSIFNKKPGHLYLIDPWEYMPVYTDRWYGGKLAKCDDDMESIFDSVKKQFGGCSNVSVCRGDSGLIVPTLPNLDWSYVDGNHSYDFVLKDISNCYNITKTGGFVCGDDLQKPEVKKALDRFVKVHKIKRVEIRGYQFIIEKK